MIMPHFRLIRYLTHYCRRSFINETSLVFSKDGRIKLYLSMLLGAGDRVILRYLNPVQGVRELGGHVVDVTDVDEEG